MLGPRYESCVGLGWNSVGFGFGSGFRVTCEWLGSDLALGLSCVRLGVTCVGLGLGFGVWGWDAIVSTQG